MRTLKKICIISMVLAGFTASHMFGETAKPVKIEGMPEHPEIILISYYGESLPGFRYAAEEFEKKTGIHVKVQSAPIDSWSMWLQTQFLSKAPPEIILGEEIAAVNEYGLNNLVLKMDDYIDKPNPFTGTDTPWKSYFKPGLVDSFRDIGGNLYLVPYTCLGIAYYYNKDTYKQFNFQPPKTWKEYVEQALYVKNHGKTAQRIAFRDDAQRYWIQNAMLHLFMRPRIPEVNLQHSPAWKFDPFNPECVSNEKITLSENIVAFEKGITDPARSPEIRQLAIIMKEFSKTWNPDFATQAGTDLLEDFVKGKSTYFMNGTWALGEITNISNVMKVIDPEKYFEVGVFPTPQITKETAGNIPLVGNINQNVGMRTYLTIPKQKEKWREEAALLFIQYITTPKVIGEIFQYSEMYDLPAVDGVPGKPGTESFNYKIQYADMNIGTFGGIDALSSSKCDILEQLYYNDKISVDELLSGFSKNQREALLHMAEQNEKDLDKEFIRKELGRDFK